MIFNLDGSLILSYGFQLAPVTCFCGVWVGFAAILWFNSSCPCIVSAF